jgi:hypothetical protein
MIDNVVNYGSGSIYFFNSFLFFCFLRMQREKRKRPHTKKYIELRATGDITESQEAHKGRRQG